MTERKGKWTWQFSSRRRVIVNMRLLSGFLVLMCELQRLSASAHGCRPSSSCATLVNEIEAVRRPIAWHVRSEGLNPLDYYLWGAPQGHCLCSSSSRHSSEWDKVVRIYGLTRRVRGVHSCTSNFEVLRNGVSNMREVMEAVLVWCVGSVRVDQHIGGTLTIRATLTRTSSASSLLRARRAVFPSQRCTVQIRSVTEGVDALTHVALRGRTSSAEDESPPPPPPSFILGDTFRDTRGVEGRGACLQREHVRHTCRPGDTRASRGQVRAGDASAPWRLRPPWSAHGRAHAQFRSRATREQSASSRWRELFSEPHTEPTRARASAGRHYSLTRGRGGLVVRELASQLGEPGTTLGRDGKGGGLSVTAFTCANCAHRCCWSAGFLGFLPFPPFFQSNAAPYSPRFALSGSQDLRAARISPLHNLHYELTRVSRLSWASAGRTYSCCLLEKAFSYLTGSLTIRQHRHGSFVIRVRTAKDHSRRAGLCLWYAGFLGDLPFPPSMNSGVTSCSPRFTLIDSQDLNSSLIFLRAGQTIEPPEAVPGGEQRPCSRQLRLKSAGVVQPPHLTSPSLSIASLIQTNVTGEHIFPFHPPMQLLCVGWSLLSVHDLLVITLRNYRLPLCLSFICLSTLVFNPSKTLPPLPFRKAIPGSWNWWRENMSEELAFREFLFSAMNFEGKNKADCGACRNYDTSKGLQSCKLRQGRVTSSSRSIVIANKFRGIARKVRKGVYKFGAMAAPSTIFPASPEALPESCQTRGPPPVVRVHHLTSQPLRELQRDIAKALLERVRQHCSDQKPGVMRHGAVASRGERRELLQSVSRTNARTFLGTSETFHGKTFCAGAGVRMWGAVRNRCSRARVVAVCGRLSGGGASIAPAACWAHPVADVIPLGQTRADVGKRVRNVRLPTRGASLSFAGSDTEKCYVLCGDPKEKGHTRNVDTLSALQVAITTDVDITPRSLEFVDRHSTLGNT
ncbi:hypothetical protein PR048_014702 [Dryococelus australis]|uniref:Uncharacterized protein n=1 Tax=Dryococelus australis TaxID=614101 RepID=A0ABQ9HF64_9NEOP|nr:hypothetical protein PR048_014702 [Dryococelus australis]